MNCYPFLRWIKFCSGCSRQVFFNLGDKKRWSLVALDKWSSYTVTVVWELAWADSALVVLDEWSSYGGGRLSRFDCRYIQKGYFSKIGALFLQNQGTFLLFSKKGRGDLPLSRPANCAPVPQKMLSRVYTQTKASKNGGKYTSCSRTEKKQKGKQDWRYMQQSFKSTFIIKGDLCWRTSDTLQFTYVIFKIVQLTKHCSYQEQESFL